MKKVLLTLAFISILTISASAQFKPFQFGLKIEPGLGLTKFNSDFSGDRKTKLSLSWGFVGNIYFVENYGISTGFNVRFMNNEYSFPMPNNVAVRHTIKNQYLEIPIGLTMRTEKIGDLRILGNVGYGLGFLLNSNDIYTINDLETSIPTEFCKLRHALIVKLGVEYYVYKSSCIVAALVFNNNFSNIYKSGPDHNVSLNNLCIEIGFMF